MKSALSLQAQFAWCFGSGEAKVAAVEAGLDDNRTALLEATRAEPAD